MSVLKELVEKRDAAASELKELVGEPGDERELSEEQEARSLELSKDLDGYDERIKEETRKAKRAARIAEARELVRDVQTETSVEVVDEPKVYGEGSPHSYYADLARVALRTFGYNNGAAEGRLNTWSHQVEREIADDTKFGREAVKQIRGMEGVRTENGEHARRTVEEIRSRGRVAMGDKGMEVRSLASGSGATASSSGGGGAAFVTPVFYVNDYAPYREVGRAFADQCNKQPLPDYGMQLYMPQVTAKAGVAQQTEGSGVNESDPTFAYLSGALITEAGQVTVSQQLLDRAGPNFSFDRMLFDQLQRDLAPNVDTYVLTQALSSPLGKTTNWTGNSSAFDLTAQNSAGASGGFYGQVSKAKAAIRTTAGTVLNPTHLFVDPARWEYIAAWTDTTARPMVVPNYAGPYNAAAGGSADGDEGIEGATGYNLNGLRVFTDHNIPAPATGADQAIVGALAEVYVYEGPQVPRVIPQTYANNLQVLIQLYEYLAVIVRYPSGVYTILGSGMATISYTN
jgi:HK97 family phage major capsid protein